MSDVAALRNQNVGARPSRWWFTAAGAVLLVLGVAGLYMTVAFTVASTLWYGVLLLIAGPAEIIEAVAQTREPWHSRAARILAGALYVAGGLYAVLQPLQASVALTLVLGLVLIASGIARAVWAVIHEVKTSRAAVILLALISVLLGMAIIQQWPWSGLWAIGLFVSCDLLAAGLSWCWAGLARDPRAAMPVGARFGSLGIK
ncbi:HdeD family acid-resistance protein [Methylobacterium segetis]|uniref:HdeD family acid-resistance protein n=1 Tax=Methylobacterium segetis TaxID=2488750 RepID=UPI00104F29C1|nr:DUF308 domain-containing protein [Methylobacterium segetis]